MSLRDPERRRWAEARSRWLERPPHPALLEIVLSYRKGSRSHSGRWIDQPLMHHAMLHEKINEAADLRRQMVAMRIDRVHRTFHRPVVRQETNQTTGLEVVGDQEARGQGNAEIPSRPSAAAYFQSYW